MQDIVPPNDDADAARARREHANEEEAEVVAEGAPPERSIRNVHVPARAGRHSRPAPHQAIGPEAIQGGRRRSSRWIWTAASLALLLLIVSAALLLLRGTTVTVTPRSQTVVFDPIMRFVAHPADAAASESQLIYTVHTEVLEDSAIVAAEGVEHVEERASGVITVFNEYSADPVRLIKNTRFQTQDGLIYRTPESIVVPGRSGSTAGRIDVEVFADQPGSQYNSGPVTRLSVPGLADTPDMFAGIYARSDGGFSGGFSGSRPAIPQATLAAARAEVRDRLESNARSIALAGDGEFRFADLARITFESLPPTTEQGGTVRIHERATIHIPAVDERAFAQAVASFVSADASEADVVLYPREGMAATLVQESPALGSEPIEFTLTGTALLVWQVDTELLADSLAGKGQDAFQSVVATFAGIETAEASLSPFWRSSFPDDPSAIDITVRFPSAQ